MQTVVLLILSNAFMVYAWYGHLETMRDTPLPLVILASWGLAFFEYALQVPANRIGYRTYDLVQLKVLQEVIHLSVFGVFAVSVMHQRLSANHAMAALCLVAAVYFAFRPAAG